MRFDGDPVANLADGSPCYIGRAGLPAIVMLQAAAAGATRVTRCTSMSVTRLTGAFRASTKPGPRSSIQMRCSELARLALVPQSNRWEPEFASGDDPAEP